MFGKCVQSHPQPLSDVVVELLYFCQHQVTPGIGIIHHLLNRHDDCECVVTTTTMLLLLLLLVLLVLVEAAVLSDLPLGQRLWFDHGMCICHHRL